MSELLVAVILVAAGLLLSLQLRRRRVAETQLHETLASVEQLVGERTEALSKAVAELKLSQQKADEASHLKDDFLATASHELRTPLNAIVGWVHVLQTGALENEAQRANALSAIARNAKVQTRLIEDLLDVSRMMQGRVTLTVEPVNLRSIVDAAVAAMQPAAAAKEITIALANGPDLLPVMGDDERLQQIAWNLLANALKYTTPGGRVDVTVTQEGQQAVLCVKDGGEGIDPQFLPFIFEPFRRGASKTMRSGLGLGLAIVQRLVHLHGGQIIADSEGLGRGAQFVVSLPLAQGAAGDVAPGAPNREPMFDRLHVLVAEDDPDSAAAVTAILRLHGCETKTAGDALECLRISGEWPADVLVCDIGLPDDDGYGLLRRLRLTPAGATLPAIALTAYTRPEDRARALASGFRAHLAKPLNPDQLLKEISDAIKAA